MQKTPSLADMQAVAPAFARYTSETVLNGLWKRPQLTPRERSIVTYAALVARNQVVEQPRHLRLALDNGVTPAEISEIVTHLAFYAGWANASAAVAAALPVFEEREIGASQLADAVPDPLPLDEAAEAQRATLVSQLFDDVAPGVVQYTTDALFRDLWLRPGLVPRERSLVTVTALVANGQAAQITYHLNRAMDNGLTKAQASETLTQLAFYSGWPNVFSAMPVFKEVFERRGV
ncbi:4-carboxymuconolactone decarboxylase [Paraburkholderia tropica]|uniref:carboxymuconolactone decarboxylase family protein n=1 Tax=Paraburkholderia tropica TaxID=92647 RepID=UPI001CADC892|nr:carboxymuconolactone decarboxylase family protein [Paraburkholderia tropica]CAG9193347.1 4-carboxymuconolactone decarboxylase [Paraburkholderia tropica]